jgi:hypothetical protein
MRRVLLGAAIFLAGMGVATAQVIPPDGKTVTFTDNSDFAYGSIGFDEWKSSVSFSFSKETNWDTGEQATHMYFSFYRELTGGDYHNGYVECWVPNNSVSATQSRASFSARVDSFDNCDGQIWHFVSGALTTEPWTYPVEITGSMSSPTGYFTELVTRTENQYLDSFVSRYQCQRGQGQEADAGGVTALVPGTETYVYAVFDSDMDAMDVAHGGYGYLSCRTLVKPTK